MSKFVVELLFALTTVALPYVPYMSLSKMLILSVFYVYIIYNARKKYLTGMIASFSIYIFYATSSDD